MNKTIDNSAVRRRLVTGNKQWQSSWCWSSSSAVCYFLCSQTSNRTLVLFIRLFDIRQAERERKKTVLSKTTNDWKLFVHNLSRKEKRRKSFFFHVILSQSNFVNVTIIDFPEFFATMNAMQTLFIVILPIGHFGRLQSSIASFLKNYEEWAKDLSMKLTWWLFNWDDSIDCLQNWHGL